MLKPLLQWTQSLWGAWARRLTYSRAAQLLPAAHRAAGPMRWQGPWLALATAYGDRSAPRAVGPSSPGRPPYDEAALLAAAQHGSLPAFNQIILHHQSLAYNVAYRIMGDADLAADATQDAFVKAFRRVEQYRGGSFKAWLLRIITNTCYDVLRARRRRPTTPLEGADEEDDPDYNRWLIDTGERPDAYVLRKELALALREAINLLPHDQRTALVLSDIEGLDYQEIADATGAALGTVKSRLSRARAKLRDILLTQQELLPAQYRLRDSK